MYTLTMLLTQAAFVLLGTMTSILPSPLADLHTLNGLPASRRLADVIVSPSPHTGTAIMQLTDSTGVDVYETVAKLSDGMCIQLVSSPTSGLNDTTCNGGTGFTYNVGPDQFATGSISIKYHGAVRNTAKEVDVNVVNSGLPGPSLFANGSGVYELSIPFTLTVQ